MELALAEARKAYSEDEVPVGAVIVHNGTVIAASHNTTRRCHDATAHAEILALRLASATLSSRYFNECVMYVTLEPCAMCAGACVNSRIGAVAFGAYDRIAGAFGSSVDLGNGLMGGMTVPTVGGIMRDECAALLSSFFSDKRKTIPT